MKYVGGKSVGVGGGIDPSASARNNGGSVFGGWCWLNHNSIKIKRNTSTRIHHAVNAIRAHRRNEFLRHGREH